MTAKIKGIVFSKKPFWGLMLWNTIPSLVLEEGKIGRLGYVGDQNAIFSEHLSP
jgi:hypothetical protein